MDKEAQKVLTIASLVLLGLCLLLRLAKMAMKKDSKKVFLDRGCSLLFFIAVVLLAVSQLLVDEGYTKHHRPPYGSPRPPAPSAECPARCSGGCSEVAREAGYVCCDAAGRPCG